jgi:hypothetical protein
MDPSLESHCDLGGMYTYSPASKCSSALTRLAKLVSPFEGLPKGSLPRGLLGRRWHPIRLLGLLVTISMKYPGYNYFLKMVLGTEARRVFV